MVNPPQVFYAIKTKRIPPVNGTLYSAKIINYLNTNQV